MLSTDVLVMQAEGFLLSEDHRFLGAFRETFEHGHYLPGRNRRPACFLWTACLLTLSS